MSFRRWLPAAFLFLLFVSAVPREATAQGTHFLLEGQGGIGITDEALLVTSFGGAVGYGGMFRGVPIRYYLMVNYAYDFSDAELTQTISTAQRREDNNLLVFGPRLYLPVAQNVRLYLECLGGFTWSHSDWLVNGLESYQSSDAGIALKFSGGIQARMLRWLSIGFGVERVVFWGKEDDPSIAAMLGFTDEVGEGDHVRAMITVGFHF